MRMGEQATTPGLGGAASGATAPCPAACILLAGGPRASPLAVEAGFSVLDLSLTPTRTVLGLWIERLAEVCPREGPRLEVRIVHDDKSPEPILSCDPGPLDVRVVAESRTFRGPAGVTKDQCEDLRGSETVLIVEGGRPAASSLVPLLADHARLGSDITVACNDDDSTAGIYVVRCGTLSLVPKNGFMDLKEQWLQRAVGAGLHVRVHRFPPPGVLSLRTREQFLAAVRVLNGLPDPALSVAVDADEAEQTPQNSRSVIARSATLAPGAVVIDSVVMEHATVASGAVVARSLVCPRAVVGPDAMVVDRVVGRGELGLSGIRGEPRGSTASGGSGASGNPGGAGGRGRR